MTDKRPSSDTPRRARPCPECSKLSVEPFYPFCSKRCSDVDLNRWLSGSYSVPVVELEPEDLAELEARQNAEDSDRM
ncbi:DNA gyrase inhibitor YacG [Stappia stellulata]|uniref:DNA gyrase inhibitor YacG n=1 Tax=Stappia stellulata TaxID=71235 RepID=UPI001CD1F36A|nr:DNA gyrase inhibitor YacG [Stappia stellulata]MCA1243520.1 DNA gyrase inhibitor YacG [Stappia stellulata]